MDYVLFGMGYGATLMLIGWALRTFGPSFKYANADESPDIDAQVKRRFWVRFIQGVGGVIAIAGTAFVFVTFVVMLVNPDDETGSFTALVVWGFLVVALLAWCWLYFGRFGLTGIWCEEEGYGLRASGSSATATNPPVRKRSLALRRSNTAPSNKSGASDDAPASSADGEAQIIGPVPEVAATEADDAAETQTAGPDYDFGEANNTSVFASRTAALRRLREKQRDDQPSEADAPEEVEQDVIDTSEKSYDQGNSGTS